MKQRRSVHFAILFCLAVALAIPARAEVSEPDQQSLRTDYLNKVLFFRTTYRMANQLEVSPDGLVKGAKSPGYWAVDAAVQVKNIEFRKDRVTFVCTKLWANLKDDGQLHFFPANAALKGKTDYPETTEINFRTAKDSESRAQLEERIRKVFLGEQESKLSTAPRPIAAYIQKIASETDVDPISGAGFTGTLPKAVKRPAPDLPREAQLVGLNGREDFIVLVDEGGSAAVLGFTHLLQYGIEDATIEAVKSWKFQPAMKDGHPATVRIPMFIEFKSQNRK